MNIVAAFFDEIWVESILIFSWLVFQRYLFLCCQICLLCYGKISSGDLMRTNFTIAYIQESFSTLCSAKFTFSCWVRGLCFCGGKKTRVHYVCLVLLVHVGR